MGKYNSSLTRVQPLFDQLLERDLTGADWLASLLAATPRSDIVPPRLLEEPGTIQTDLGQSHGGRRRCFEYPVPPSESFLRWLIQHPDQLTWPTGRAGEFGPETTEWRRRLVKGTPDERQEAIVEGLRDLDATGAMGSRGQPWAFEGWTSVDCCLETERLIFVIEGKRTEKVSASTAWFPARNQLVRNLEVIGELHPDKPGFVVLATENLAQAPSRDDLPGSAPHLRPVQLDALWARYLGQITWEELCSRVGVTFDTLPDTVS